MNAYELATGLENHFKNNFITSESALLLRQQADRIAELEKQLDIRTRELIGASFYEHDYKTLMANSEPVAWMQTWQNQDGELKQTVNIEQIGKQDIPLYTNPVKELNAGGEPVKNATYWKRQYNLMASQNDNLKSGLYHANEQIKYLEFTPQTKPLSDEPSVKEITDLWLDVINNRPANDKRPIEWHFANALLAKVRGEK